VTGYRAPELAPISSWRSVGASSNGFFYNAGLDELIHAAGADPMEERLRLCSNPEARKVLEAVAEMSGWDGVLGDGRGRGVALTQSFGVHCAEVIEVTAIPITASGSTRSGSPPKSAPWSIRSISTIWSRVASSSRSATR
jgi:isoquinoline 1-oxidoreductase beta subunit